MYSYAALDTKLLTSVIHPSHLFWVVLFSLSYNTHFKLHVTFMFFMETCFYLWCFQESVLIFSYFFLRCSLKYHPTLMVLISFAIHSFDFRNPATFLHAYTCLPLAYATRQAAGAILQDVADSGVLFAILMCKHKVTLNTPSPFFLQSESFHP